MTTLRQPTTARSTLLKTDAAVIHVCYAGRSFDISMIGLDLTPASSDEQVKQEIGNYLVVADSLLERHVIDRHASGNLTIRPQAACK